MKTINEVGNRYGRLTVIERSGSDSRGLAKWLCKCDCGETSVVRGKDLRQGHTRSCGCLERDTQRENGKKRMPVKHAESYARLYEVWHGMKARCYRKSHPYFKDYGGRGVKVCPEWFTDYLSFAKWAVENGYDENAPKGACTLDRIDPDGNYEPANCRFADMRVQQNNRRDRNKVEVVKGADGIYHVSPNCGAKVVER